MKKKTFLCLLTVLAAAFSAAPVSAASDGIETEQLEEMSLEDLKQLQIQVGRQISSLEAADAEDAGSLFLETAGGTILYTGYILNNQNFKTSGSSDYVETLLILFDYTNNEAQEKQIQSDFRIQAYQNGVELSKASSWISSETLPEEVNNTYKNVLKGGTITTAFPFVPEDNSPVTLTVTAMGLAADGEKASMELASWKEEEEIPESSTAEETEEIETDDAEASGDEGGNDAAPEDENAAAPEEGDENAAAPGDGVSDAKDTGEETGLSGENPGLTDEGEDKADGPEAAESTGAGTEKTVTGTAAGTAAADAKTSEQKTIDPEEVEDLLQGIWMLQTIENLFTFEDGDVSIKTADSSFDGMYMINTKTNCVDLLMKTSIGLVTTSLPFKVENETLTLSNNQGDMLAKWDVEYAAEPVIYTDEETIEKVQEALNEAGYDCGTPDGIAGRNTYAAMNEYQEAHDLPVTNDITDALLKSLGI